MIARRKLIEYVLWFLTKLYLYYQLEHEQSQERHDTDLSELHVTSYYQLRLENKSNDCGNPLR